MPKDPDDKAFFIAAYYDDLKKRISFLEDLHANGHDNEALMLCCCYIEALGSHRYHDSDRKAKNYCTILKEYGNNEIFSLAHPKQISLVLSKLKLFQNNISLINKAVTTLGNNLYNEETITETFAPLFTQQQKEWLSENFFKLTIAAISYELVRSELVHDLSAAPVSFSETTFNGKPIPRLDFQLLYGALQSVFADEKRQSIETNKWYWEQ